ncbi:MAG: SDR family NAD(P)-dependent oxidoreductase [Betaproteobacteria bacterium]|nr:SDR family NAD(P)-dependent oxidoreductase [Betaproteobacteria bacterium]
MVLPAFTIDPHWTPPADALKDRAILITGAGQGVGRATALACAKAGATIVLLGRTTAKLEAVYDGIMTLGAPEPAIAPLDLAKADQEQLRALALSIKTTLGRLDGIVHAASNFASTMPLELLALEAWELTMRMHVTAPAALTQACYPLLKKSPDASVVFLTETHALEPRAYWGGFATAKSALAHLVAVWADEHAEAGPRFNLVLPGPIRSPMRQKSHPGESAATLRTTEDVAHDIVNLLAAGNARITGRLVKLDAAQ